VISASEDLSCGNGGDPCPTITIEPGGTVLTVTTSGRRHPFSHRRRHDRHDGTTAAAVPPSPRRSRGWRLPALPRLITIRL
jgi:hypothetical protein